MINGEKKMIRESLKIIYGKEELDFVLFVNNLLIFQGWKGIKSHKFMFDDLFRMCSKMASTRIRSRRIRNPANNCNFVRHKRAEGRCNV